MRIKMKTMLALWLVAATVGARTPKILDSVSGWNHIPDSCLELKWVANGDSAIMINHCESTLVPLINPDSVPIKVVCPICGKCWPENGYMEAVESGMIGDTTGESWTS